MANDNDKATKTEPPLEDAIRGLRDTPLPLKMAATDTPPARFDASTFDASTFDAAAFQVANRPPKLSNAVLSTTEGMAAPPASPPPPAEPVSTPERGGPGGLQVDRTNEPASRNAAPSSTAQPRPLYRDGAERAERLARALLDSVRSRLEHLKQRNDPTWQPEIDFLELVSTGLEQIAQAISEARQSPTPKRREEKFREAESRAGWLATACREYAERNRERIIDYGGDSAFVVLGTLFFVGLLGVPAEIALAAQCALLRLPPFKK